MKVMVTGAGGMLARALLAELPARGHHAVALDRRALDVTNADACIAALRAHRPDAVIQCAAYTRVDDAEREESRALAVNGDGARNVARACAGTNARFIYPSTDYVFDGTARAPYRPDHAVDPINAYGRTKRAGERAVSVADALIVRTAWLYGAGGRNFVRTILDRARAGLPLRVVDDQHGSPTWTRDLARILVSLLERKAPAGVYHATNSGATTWYGMACAVLEEAGIDADITPVPSAEFPTPATRPSYSVLDCSATWAITGPAPEWRDGLAAALREGVHD